MPTDKDDQNKKDQNKDDQNKENQDQTLKYILMFFFFLAISITFVDGVSGQKR